jgi:hypothetical protein
MADFTLAAPRLRVLRGSLDAPEILEVQTLNPDLIAWDMTRMKHKWPKMEDAPWKWLTFLSWHAARREGRIPSDLSYEVWEASTLEVSNIDAAGEDAEEFEVVDPTPPGPVPG